MRVLKAAAALVVASIVVLTTPGVAQADETRARQWYLEKLRITDAHAEATGEGVTIGLIDSGVDTAHQDIADNVIDGQEFGEPPGPADQEAGNGTADAAVLAGHGHGENAGILGVAPDAKVISATIDTQQQAADQGALIADAMKFLIEREVDVISVALPVTTNERIDAVMRQAIEKGIPVVGASSGPQVDFAFGAKGAVNTVGSGKDNEPATGEATVPDPESALTVAAPSQDIPLAVPNDGYSEGGGPSFPVQIVAGTLALLKEKNPDADGDTLIGILRDTASGEGRSDDELGFGVIDPFTALQSTAEGSSGGISSSGPAGVGDNDTLALVIGLFGVLALSTLVLVVRLRDRSHRLALLRTVAATGFGDTGTMPRLSDTGTFPRISDAPSSGAPSGRPPSRGTGRPGR